MKLTSVLTLAALLGLVAFVMGLSFGMGALPIFAAVASTLVLLIGVSDYLPRRDLMSACGLRSRSERIPLAA